MAEKKENKEKYILTEVATQTTPVIKDTTIDKILTPDEVLLLVLNKVDKIEKNITG